MATTFLKLYKEWMETGRLSDVGLCNSLKSHPEMKAILINNFQPTPLELIKLNAEGNSLPFWASGLPIDNDYNDQRFQSFTPLRQTIMLLCAALNGEFD